MKIGIDLGGSHIAVGVVSPEGKILGKEEKDIDFININKSEVELLIRDTIVSLINNVLKRLEIPPFVIEEIGIGIPGIVENNIIKKCDKFGLANVDLAKGIEEYYGVTTKLINDAECAAIAEREYGSLKGKNNAVFLCLGTGIGGATIINNNLINSEYGHMIIEKNGKECNCLNKGCFEQYSSMRVFKENIINILNLNCSTTSEDILNIIKQQKDNKEIDSYINEYTEDLIVGLTNIINIIKPEIICFGGGFVYFQDILYKRLLEKIQLHKFQFNKPELVLAKLQNDAGIIGATFIE